MVRGILLGLWCAFFLNINGMDITPLEAATALASLEQAILQKEQAKATAKNDVYSCCNHQFDHIVELEQHGEFCHRNDKKFWLKYGKINHPYVQTSEHAPKKRAVSDLNPVESAQYLQEMALWLLKNPA